MALSLRLSAVLILAAGCGPSSPAADGGATTDGGPDASRSGPAEAPADPAEPTPVAAVERACPEGWAASDDGCMPFSAEPTCTGAAAALPGLDECTSVGSPCPAGEFAAAASAGETIYVSATAAGPGDGTAGAPYDQLFRALGRATAGTTILLSKGAHTGEATLPGGVHLRGACAAETSLSAATPSPNFPTLLVEAGHAEVSDLTLTGRRPGLFAIGAASRVTVRGVLIEGVPGAGLLAQGGTIDVEEVILRDVSQVSGMAGRGADAIRGGTLNIRRSTIEGTEGGGTLAGSDAVVTLTDVLYRDFPERAVSAQTGADVTLERVAMLRVGQTAVNANNVGTTIVASDLTIDGVTSADAGGRGISVGVGASFEAAGLVVTNVEEHALFVTDLGSVAQIEDAHLTRAGGRGLNAQRGGQITARRVVLRDLLDVSVLSSSEAQVTLYDGAVHGGGRALRAQTGGQLRVERAHVVGAIGDAVQSTEAGTSITVEDLVVEGPGSVPDGSSARGAAAFSGSSLTLRRARLTGCRTGAVVVFDSETSVVLEDVQIDGVFPHGDGTAGYGFLVAEASLDLSRVSIERAHTIGIVLAQGARVVARDIIVRATRPEVATGQWGRAVSAEGPGDRLTVERGLFEESVSAGIFAGGEGTVVDLTDTVIRATARRVCESSICLEAGGVGLVSFYGAVVRLRSFVLADNGLAGAQLGAGGEIDLSDGEVRNQPIGVSIQTPGYDVNRLTDGVHYIDNQSNLDSTDLPVPSETPPELVSDEPPEDPTD